MSHPGFPPGMLVLLSIRLCNLFALAFLRWASLLARNASLYLTDSSSSRFGWLVSSSISFLMRLICLFILDLDVLLCLVAVSLMSSLKDFHRDWGLDVSWATLLDRSRVSCRCSCITFLISFLSSRDDICQVHLPFLMKGVLAGAYLVSTIQWSVGMVV